MFEKKETPYYKRYYLFGKCVWKKQKSVKAVSDYLLNKISEMCAAVQKNTDDNVHELQSVQSDFDTKLKSVSDNLNKQIQSLSGATDGKIENIKTVLTLLNDKQSSYFDTVNKELNTHSELLKNMQSKIEWEINKIHFLNAVTIRNEVEYHGFTLNKDWEKSFVNYRIESYELLQIPVQDLFIDDWLDEKMGTAVKVTESPNYKYLCGDKSDYIQRCKNEPSHSCESFDALIKKLDKEGFDKSKIIVCQQDFHIVDGAHRASYLAYKYGPDYVVNVLKLVLV